MKTYKHSNMDYKVQDNFLPKENLENIKKEVHLYHKIKKREYD